MGSVGRHRVHLPSGFITSSGVGPMKKGRHRRFEEARALKRSSEPSFNEIIDRADERSCPECGADPGHDHASWCLAMADDLAEADDWA